MTAQPKILTGPVYRRPAPDSVIRRVLRQLVVWQQRSAERAHLRDIEPRLLQDAGISRADAAREAAKPFWRD